MVRGGRSVAERAASTSADVEPQESLFDEVVENELLEAALERRMSAKDALKPKKKAYDDADAAAKGIISGLELDDPQEGEDPLVIRCGRFRIKKSARGGNKVSFETSPGLRTTISLIKDD